MVSEPGDEGTIVLADLSAVNLQVSPRQRLLEAQYIVDCRDKGQLLDMDDYRLRLDPSSSSPRKRDRRSQFTAEEEATLWRLHAELSEQGVKPDSPLMCERISRALPRHPPQSIRARLNLSVRSKLKRFAERHQISELFALSLLWALSGRFDRAEAFLACPPAERTAFQPAPWTAQEDRLLLKGILRGKDRTQDCIEERRAFLKSSSFN